jgi:hypothetical protein
MSKDTVAIISAIENASEVARVIADSVAKELQDHTKSDDKRFDDLTKLVESISENVRSLLDSRQFFRGAWWALVGMAGLIGAVIVWVIHYLTGKG